MIITDIIYGLAALTLLGSGIMRVLYFGQGSEFYTQNPLFWWKVGLYLGAGAFALSRPPTSSGPFRCAKAKLLSVGWLPHWLGDQH